MFPNISRTLPTRSCEKFKYETEFYFVFTSLYFNIQSLWWGRVTCLTHVTHSIILPSIFYIWSMQGPFISINMQSRKTTLPPNPHHSLLYKPKMIGIFGTHILTLQFTPTSICISFNSFITREIQLSVLSTTYLNIFAQSIHTYWNGSSSDKQHCY